MDNVTLSLGGIPILIQSDERRIVDLTRGAFKGFIVTGRNHTISLKIIIDEDMAQANPYVYGNPHRIHVTSGPDRLFLRGSVYSGAFDRKKLEAEVRMGPSTVPLYLFLRFILSVYLPAAGGFFLHSACIADGGRGYLFSGKPQSGKSTVARLSEGHTVLSDDFSIIRKVKGVFCCFASPFWGHVEVKGNDAGSLNKCLPIGGLYFLKQDNEVYAAKLNRAEAAFLLIQNVLILAKDKTLQGTVIKLAEEITRSVGAYNLHFKLDNSFWRCIKNA